MAHKLRRFINGKSSSLEAPKSIGGGFVSGSGSESNNNNNTNKTGGSGLADPLDLEEAEILELFEIKVAVVLKKYPCRIANSHLSAYNRGTLYVTSDWFLFVVYSFGKKRPIKVLIADIHSIHKTNNQRSIKMEDVSGGSYWLETDNIEETCDFLNKVWRVAKLRRVSDISALAFKLTQDELLALQSISPPTLWNNCDPEGKIFALYQKGEVVVSKGDLNCSPKLWFIKEGACRLEWKSEKLGTLFVPLEEGSWFGASELLLGTAPIYTVVATQNNTKINFLEAFHLNVIFQHDPSFPPRVYFKIGQSLLDYLHLFQKLEEEYSENAQDK